MHKEEKKDGAASPDNEPAFAGSESCAGCHKNIYDKHLQTAHYLTSRPPLEQYIKGSFHPDENKYFFNRSVLVAMEKREDGFYQVEYFKELEKKARRIDMVVGSGTMGQSFLNYRDSKFFQLPITYFSAAKTWSNSPGFPDKVVFNRVITSRCLECHTSYASVTSPPGKEPETFDNNRIIYGVDCEKCHGAAVKHVQFHAQNPTDTIAKFIINPATLTREQNLDLCASCHGGRLQKTKPSFSYTVGAKLSDHFLVDTTPPRTETIDVHANQYGLLRASPCFKNSITMTCTTCHNTHENERGNTLLFSQRCMDCHGKGPGKDCKLKKTVGKAINKNCVDCHMPLQPSRAISVRLQGTGMPVSALVRSHFISIYPDEAKRIINELKKER